MWGGISLWFWFAFIPWWLVMLSIFSSACCPSAFSFGKLSIQFFYPVHRILQARILDWVAFPFSRGSSQPRDQTQVSRIVGWFFTSWATPSSQECSRTVVQLLSRVWPHGLYSPWNSPVQNTEVGSCSLLHRIFPTQGSNPGLPHCGRILSQLSHKGSPIKTSITKNK